MRWYIESRIFSHALVSRFVLETLSLAETPSVEWPGKGEKTRKMILSRFPSPYGKTKRGLCGGENGRIEHH